MHIGHGVFGVVSGLFLNISQSYTSHCFAVGGVCWYCSPFGFGNPIQHLGGLRVKGFSAYRLIWIFCLIGVLLYFGDHIL